MWIRHTLKLNECVLRTRVCKSPDCKHKAKTVERFQEADEDASVRRVGRVVKTQLEGIEHTLFRMFPGAPRQSV